MKNAKYSDVKRDIPPQYFMPYRQDERIGGYKLTDLEDRTAHDLVVRAFDVGVCCNRHIPQVLHEWRQPRHEEFQPRNVWSLFNAFTETLKGRARCLVAHPVNPPHLIPLVEIVGAPWTAPEIVANANAFTWPSRFPAIGPRTESRRAKSASWPSRASC